MENNTMTSMALVPSTGIAPFGSTCPAVGAANAGAHAAAFTKRARRARAGVRALRSLMS